MTFARSAGQSRVSYKIRLLHLAPEVAVGEKQMLNNEVDIIRNEEGIERSVGSQLLGSRTHRGLSEERSYPRRQWKNQANSNRYKRWGEWPDCDPRRYAAAAGLFQANRAAMQKLLHIITAALELVKRKSRAKC